MKPDESAKIDQTMAWMVESLPSLWWGLYENLVMKGFSKEQALTLLITYISVAHRTT